MALKVEKGVFTAPGATGNQTITLADTGFGTVKAIILWTTVQDAEGDLDGNALFSFGMGTYQGAVVQQSCTSIICVDAGASSANARGGSIFALLTGMALNTPTADFSVTLVSLDDHEFVINWSDLPALASIKINYMALGGSDITDARVDSFGTGTTLGTLDITVASGFGKPDLLLATASRNDSTSGNESGHAIFMFGAGKSDSEQYSTCFGDNTASGTMASSSIQNATFINVIDQASGMLVVDALTAKASWPTDGFQINLTTAPAASIRIHYLALKGTFTSVIGANTVPTAAPTVDQDLAVGSTPRGAFFFHNSLPTTAGLDITHGALSTIGLGAMDGTNEGHSAAGQDDGNTTATTHRHHSESKAIKMFTNGPAGSLTSEADASFSGNNVRLSWADTDTLAREYCYVLFGDGGIDVFVPRHPAHDHANPAVF